jgi:tetratricopeptide (TPR) repeat protein
LNAAGVKLSKDDKVPEAIQIYNDCLKYVKNAEYAGKIHYNLGLGYSRLGKNKEAVDHLQQSLKFIPNFEKAAELLKRVKPKGAA